MDSQASALHRVLSTSRLKKEVVSIIVSLYNKIFPDSKRVNQDFVVSFEALVDEVLLNLTGLIASKLDRYKFGQLIIVLLRDHVIDSNSTEKQQSIESQIDNFEYDICQSSVVKLFGLLSNDTLRRIIYTTINETKLHLNDDLNSHGQQYPSYRSSARATAGLSLGDYIEMASCQQSASEPIRTTSALYTLIIAMLTKAVVMPIVDSISDPKFLLASIIWICKKEEADRLKREKLQSRSAHRGDRGQSVKDDTIVKRYHDIGKQTNGTSIIVTNPRGVRSLDLEEGYDIASANINFINPICGSLKRPIENIEIFSTEEVKSNNSCYVLYCIRYDGICYRHPSAGGYKFFPDSPEVPIIDKRQTHSVRRRNNGGIETTSHMVNEQQKEVPIRKSFRRSMVVKRRFREFVLLQLRLEENPKTRVFMSKMPKPTKLKAATQNIFSLPGINSIKLDQSTIRIRQRFLERFLNALNNSPFISNSYEFKEFFSYNVNPVGMSKSKSTILQVNLNKVLVDGVKSAFTMIRSTLPGDDYQSLRSNLHSDPDAWLTELQQSTLKLHIQTRPSQSKMNLERLIDAKLSSMDDSPVRTNTNKSSTLSRYYQELKYQQQQQQTGDWVGASRGGSLKARSSSSSISSSVLISRSSSSNLNSQNVDSTSKSVSDETLYHDASNEFETQNLEDAKSSSSEAATKDQTPNNSIQICDSFPIASKFIDIIHYSISKNPICSSSPLNFAARLLFGRMIER